MKKFVFNCEGKQTFIINNIWTDTEEDAIEQAYDELFFGDMEDVKYKTNDIVYCNLSAIGYDNENQYTVGIEIVKDFTFTAIAEDELIAWKKITESAEYKKVLSDGWKDIDDGPIYEEYEI